MSDKKSNWRDRAVPVTDKADAPKSSWRERAVPVEEESLWDAAKGNLAALVSKGEQMIPGSGIIDKIGAASYATQQEVGDLFRDDANKKDWKERYQKVLDDQDTERKTLEDKYPIADAAGMAVGMVPNVLLPIPGAGMKDAAGIATRVLGNTAISAADEATRNKDELLDLEAGQDAALLSGGISAGVEALPLVGKAAKEIKKFIPATEGAHDWVNRLSAAPASAVYGENLDKVVEILKDKKGRLDARKINPESTKRITEKLAEDLTKTKESAQKVIDAIYKAGDADFMSKVDSKELPVMRQVPALIEDLKSSIAERPQLYSKRVESVVNKVDDIISKGGLNEKEFESFGRALNDIEKDQAFVLSRRLVEGRRTIDDVLKNKDFDNFLKGEKEIILNLRDGINDALDKIPSAKEFRKGDKVISEYLPQEKNTLDKLLYRHSSGDKIFEPEKIEKFLKSDSMQANILDSEIEKFTKLLTDLPTDNLSKYTGSKQKDIIPNFKNRAVTLQEEVKKAREAYKQLGTMQRMKSSFGGPTGQGVNLSILQTILGYATGGWSLLALPITNPIAWMGIVDGAGSLAEKEFLQKITKAANEVTKKSPQTATRLYMMNKEDDNK